MFFLHRFRLLLLLTALPLISAGLFSGCSDRPADSVDQVTILQGNEQRTLPGKAFDQELRLELAGPRVPGLLGGEGNRAPVVGHKVFFEPADGSDLTVEPKVAESDAGGMVRVRVRAGHQTGDQYLWAIPDGAPEKKVLLRFISGIEIDGAGKEYRAGTVSKEPLTVKLVRPDGTPAVGVPVYFKPGASVEGLAAKTEIRTPVAFTDNRGVARTDVKIGEKTGVYQVGIEVADPESGFLIRGTTVELFGLNLVSVIISVLGGLALFVFGMKLMSDGIMKVAGESMKKVLQFFARNGIVAVLAGTLVTAIIQSSSATTVMVIGFINAGLLSLTQAIGIIFGANIGTTVTAQIISFNLAGLALPAITIGFLITLSKRRVINGWGETILGFGLLFFGMTLMSDELRALGDLQSFKDFFRLFNCAPAEPGGWMPFGAVAGAIGIGIAATVIIQSSSAAMGIVLALSGSGLINFYTAVPLLVGTNIGTTITAMLAAAAANRVAKQAALAHTLFNVFGALVMLILFYVPYGPERIPVFLYFVNATTPGDVFAAVPQNIERHIAMAHTFFNVAVVILLLPFIRQFGKLCSWLLPVPENTKIKIKLLEPNLLATPSVALKQTVSAIRKMVDDSWTMVDRAVNNHFIPGKVDEKKFAALDEMEERIDEMQAEVTAYLVQITRRQLTEPQSELVPLLMHCTNDAERIADHVEVILQLTERLANTGRKLSDSGVKDLRKMWELLNDQQKNVLAALGSNNPETIRFALKDERKINKFAEKYEQAHIDRLRKGNCPLVNSVIFIEMLGELAKIGDHLCNIAERTPEIQKHYIKL